MSLHHRPRHDIKLSESFDRRQLPLIAVTYQGLVVITVLDTTRKLSES